MQLYKPQFSCIAYYSSIGCFSFKVVLYGSRAECVKLLPVLSVPVSEKFLTVIVHYGCNGIVILLTILYIEVVQLRDKLSASFTLSLIFQYPVTGDHNFYVVFNQRIYMFAVGINCAADHVEDGIKRHVFVRIVNENNVSPRLHALEHKPVTVVKMFAVNIHNTAYFAYSCANYCFACAPVFARAAVI